MATTVAAAGEAATKTNYISKSPLIWAIWAIWGAGIYMLASSGALTPSEGQPPVAVLLNFLGPPILFRIAYKILPPLRAWVSTLDLAELTALQAWRVVGAAFLFGWSLNVLPTVFVMPAGLGDIAVGIAAPFAAIAIAKGLPIAKRRARIIVWAGLIDFAVALPFGVLAREDALLHFAGEPTTNAMSNLPFAMIPNFIVPGFIILHILAIIKLREIK